MRIVIEREGVLYKFSQSGGRMECALWKRKLCSCEDGFYFSIACLHLAKASGYLYRTWKEIDDTE